MTAPDSSPPAAGKPSSARSTFDSPTDRERVSLRIAAVVMEFATLRLASEPEFRVAELHEFVKQRAQVAPASADRILRLLRAQGTLDYEVTNRSKSLYRFLKGESMANDIATVPAESGINIYHKFDNPIEAIGALGDSFHNSRMFGCHNQAQGRVLALACFTEGRSPIEIKRKYHIIGGNLSMRADAMLAEFTRQGGSFEIIERTPDRVAIQLKQPNSRKKYDFAFTWEEAQKEDYVYKKDGKTPKDNWQTPRRRMQMLWARLISDAVRATWPQVCAGQYTPEELSGEVAAEPQEDAPVDVEFEVKEEPQATASEAAEPVKEDPPAETPAVEPTNGEAIEKPRAGEYDEGQPGIEEVTREQLEEMLAHKKAMGIGKEGWSQILDKFGVTSAKKLSRDEADRLIRWLAKQARKRSSQQERSEWAEQATKPPEGN